MRRDSSTPPRASETPDEVTADEVAQQGSGAGVKNAGPHHVTWNRNHAIADGESEVRRQRPKHAHETEQQDGSLQKTDAEIGRKLGQVTRIFVHALVGVDADRSGAREPECATRQHPKIDEIQRQPFAQLELERFRQPALKDVEHEQCTRDDAEHAELHEKRFEIAPFQRVVERLIPTVESDLPIGRRYDDQKDHAAEPQQRVTHGGSPGRLEHHCSLRHQACAGDVAAVGSGRVLRLVGHELARSWSMLILPGTANAVLAMDGYRDVRVRRDRHSSRRQRGPLTS
jgi:hypothetical protein